MKFGIKHFLSLFIIFALVSSIFLFTAISVNAAYFTDGANFTVHGDINNDGNIDIRDLVKLKKESVVVDLKHYSNFDLNGDNQLNSNDLVLLKGIILDIDNSKWTTQF